jgi:hypothetical protein
MNELNIRCKVYPGQFTGEYAVSAAQVGGGEFSLFVPESYVQADENPTRDRAVDGWLKVSLYKQEGDCAIVQLPRECLESGRYVTVSLQQAQNGMQLMDQR